MNGCIRLIAMHEVTKALMYYIFSIHSGRGGIRTHGAASHDTPSFQDGPFSQAPAPYLNFGISLLTQRKHGSAGAKAHLAVRRIGCPQRVRAAPPFHRCANLPRSLTNHHSRISFVVSISGGSGTRTLNGDFSPLHAFKARCSSCRSPTSVI